ncbi:hypothetical protein JCM10207_006965 [Rhodosporidiobolus poonsookiae]
MSPDYIHDALRSLQQSSAYLDALPFHSSCILPRAVLCSEDAFEHHLIRDAAPHELALFEPAPATQDFASAGVDAEELLARERGGDKWVANKRKGPTRVSQRDRASPLKDRRRTTAPGHTAVDEPDRCLRAAMKLLDIYSMPRGTEHVHALHSQWVGVVDSISDLEEALRRPPSRPAPQPEHSDSYYRQLELEDQIKREQLELFAVQQLRQEKEDEMSALRPRPRASAATGPLPTSSPAKPAPTAKPTRKVPSVVASARTRPPAPRTSVPGAAAAGAEDAPAPQAKKRVPSVVAAAQRTRPSLGSGSKASALPPPVPVVPSSPPPSSAPPSDADADSTPQPARVAPSSSSALPPAAPALELAEGVSPLELSLALSTVWDALGEANTSGGVGLRAWGRKWAREEGRACEGLEKVEGEEGEGGKAPGVEETSAILRYALLHASSPSSADGPASPSAASLSSLASTANADPASAEPPSWTPAQLVESYLVLTLFCSLCPSLPSPPAALPVILRDPLLTGLSKSKTPCVSMALLKKAVGAWAVEQGWTDEMGTTAVYALVSKGVVRIDRRGREGAAVGIRT